MTIVNNVKKKTHYTSFRYRFHCFVQRLRLKNKNPTIISSNCIGGSIYHDLGLRFNSPFINVKLMPSDFIIMLKDLKKYMNIELLPFMNHNFPYPIGRLGEIKIHFVHYESFEEAKNKWDERKKRMNYENIFIIFTDRDGCTDADIQEFDHTPYKNKVIFTNKKDLGIQSAVYIKGFDNEDSVGMLMHYREDKPFLKYYDYFDYVKWFNNGINNT